MFPYYLNRCELGYVKTEGFLHDLSPQEALELTNPSENPVQTSAVSGSLRTTPDHSGSSNPICLRATFPKALKTLEAAQGPQRAKAAGRACWLQTQSDGLLYSILRVPFSYLQLETFPLI